jgi:hypothetical protein
MSNLYSLRPLVKPSYSMNPEFALAPLEDTACFAVNVLVGTEKGEPSQLLWY